jgi:hypothetical protein
MEGQETENTTNVCLLLLAYPNIRGRQNVKEQYTKLNHTIYKVVVARTLEAGAEILFL